MKKKRVRNAAKPWNRYGKRKGGMKGGADAGGDDVPTDWIKGREQN